MLHKRCVRIILKKSDFDNIFGLDKYLSRTEYDDLLIIDEKIIKQLNIVIIIPQYGDYYNY